MRWIVGLSCLLALPTGLLAGGAGLTPKVSDPPLLTRLALEEPSYFAIGAGTRKHGARNSLITDPGNQAKFRLSLRVPMLSIDHAGDGLFFSFSQESLWNPFDGSAASLDNSYTPEFIGWWEMGKAKRGARYRWWQPSLELSYTHQSNGFIGPTSRSWNRAMLRLAFGDPAVETFCMTVKGWFPFSVDHRNSDLAKYRGLGELSLLIQPGGWSGEQGSDPLAFHLVTVLAPQGRFVASLEATMTVGMGRLLGSDLPLGPTLLLDYYNGHGESFLNYRQDRHELRIGIAVVR